MAGANPLPHTENHLLEPVSGEMDGLREGLDGEMKRVAGGGGGHSGGGQCTVCGAFVGPPKGNSGAVISRLAGLSALQDETQIMGVGVCACVRVWWRGVTLLEALCSRLAEPVISYSLFTKLRGDFQRQRGKMQQMSEL